MDSLLTELLGKPKIFLGDAFVLLVFSFAPLFCEFSVKNVFGQKLRAWLNCILSEKGSVNLGLTLMPHVRHCSIPIITGLVNGFKYILGNVTTCCQPLK